MELVCIRYSQQYHKNPEVLFQVIKKNKVFFFSYWANAGVWDWVVSYTCKEKGFVEHR